MDYSKKLSDAEQKGLEIRLEEAKERDEENFTQDSTVNDYVNHVVVKEAEIALRQRYEMREHNKLKEKIDAMTIDEIASAMDDEETSDEEVEE